MAAPGNLDDVVHAIREIACRELSIAPAELDPTAPLRSITRVDSIRILRAVVGIEAHFDVELDDELVFNVRTLEDLGRAVLERTEAAVEPPG